MPGVSPLSLELVSAKACIPDKWLTVLDRIVGGGRVLGRVLDVGWNGDWLRVSVGVSFSGGSLRVFFLVIYSDEKLHELLISLNSRLLDQK